MRVASCTGLILSVMSAGCGAAPQAVPPPGTAPSPQAAVVKATAVAAAPAGPEFDLQFIDMMVPHHEGALEMAQVAQGRTRRPEIRRLALDILRGQANEIAQLKRWRADWYGSGSTPPMSHMPMLGMVDGSPPHLMNMAADVTRLRGAPEPFDMHFIDAMIEHHQSAVDAAKLAIERARRPEIRSLARVIGDAQTGEIAQMQAWRQAWFGASVPNTSTSGPRTSPQGTDAKPSDGHEHE